MDYLKGIVRAFVPRKVKDAVIIASMTVVLFGLGYKTLLQSAPDVALFAETQYPKEVIRGSYFYLNFDLSFGSACAVTARRYIISSDGTEYLALEDFKEVQAGERMKYVVRIPVDINIPLGPAFIRSDFEYGCDWWSRHVRSIYSKGRTRSFTILSQAGELLKKSSVCALPDEPGMSIVRAHYRRRTPAGLTASQH